MGNEELKPGDVVQHKATGKILVVLEKQPKEVVCRDEDNFPQHYQPFEVIKLNEDQWKDRLNQKNKGTEEMTKKMGND